MDAVTFIRQSLNQVHERLLSSLEGLDQHQIAWRAAPHANTILEILWHTARAGDRMGSAATGRSRGVWESQDWRRRFGYEAEGGPDEEYQFLRERGARPPDLSVLIEYVRAVHDANLRGLRELSADDLEDALDPARPGRTRAAVLRHMITHYNNHHGQIDFIRGLIEPGWDLPPGTGMTQA